MIDKIADKYVTEEPDEFEAFKRPPNVNFAIDHGVNYYVDEQRAMKFGPPFDSKVDHKLAECPCCGYQVDVKELPLSCGRDEMAFNGEGVPLYFEFLIFTMAILVILGVVSGIYNIVQNHRGNQCQKKTGVCNTNFFNLYAQSNRDGGLDITQCVLDLISTILIIGATMYYRRYMNLTSNELDNASILISDYAIQVNNIPRNATLDRIRTFFSTIPRRGQQVNLEIRQICLGYNIEDLIKKQNEKLQKETAKSSLLYNKNRDEQQVALLNEQIASIDKELNALEVDMEKKFRFSGVAFITYNRAQQSKQVRRHFNLSKLQIMLSKVLSLISQNDPRKFDNNIIEVLKAPEPGDVIWENLGIDPWVQFRRELLTNGFTFILLGVCFGIILGISYGQNAINNQYSQNNQTSLVLQAQITVLGIVASVTITVLNILLGGKLRELVLFEKPGTQTEYTISFAYKLGLSQFINTAIITLIVKLFAVADSNSIFGRMFVNGGLNQNVMLILITNAILPWILTYFDIWYLIKLFKQHSIRKQGPYSLITQKEANLTFEGPIIDLSRKYSTITKTLMLTFFYAQQLPVGIPIAIGSIILIYWTDKYVFLKRSSRGPPIGQELAKAMTNFYVELALCLFAAGNCIWQQIIYGWIHGVTWAQLAISLLQFLLPLDFLFDHFFEVEEVDTRQSYDESRETIIDDFMRRNPVTMAKAIEEWINEKGGGAELEAKKKKHLHKLKKEQNHKKQKAQIEMQAAQIIQHDKRQVQPIEESIQLVPKRAVSQYVDIQMEAAQIVNKNEQDEKKQTQVKGEQFVPKRAVSQFEDI